MSTVYVQYPQGGGGGGSSGSQTGVPYIVGPLDGAAKNNLGGTIGSFTFYQQTATASAPGLVSSGNQTFAGIKTFSNGIVSSVTGLASLNLPLTGGTLTGSVSMSANAISGVLDPSGPQDAATRNYVDTQLAAFQPLEAVAEASIVNYPGILAANVLTITATGAIVVDGITPSANDRILLKDQTTGAQNGVYVVTGVGSVGVSPILTRAADYNTAADVNSGASIPVLNGATNKLTSWIQTATVVTINTDALVFTKFSSNPNNVPITVGAFDGAAASINGAVIGSSSLYLQSASVTNPGLVSSALQSFAGTKTLSGAFLPGADATYNIGTVSSRFANLYVSTLAIAGTATVNATTGFSGSGGFLKLQNGGWSQFYFDGTSLQGNDSAGFATITFKNAGNPNYVFYNPGNSPLFTLNSNSLSLTVQGIFPKTTTPILVLGSVSITQDPLGNTYPWTLPASQGTASWVLQNTNGLGSLSWVSALTNPSGAIGQAMIRNTAGSPAWVNEFSFQNIAINSGFDYWQCNGLNSSVSWVAGNTLAYVCDQFYVNNALGGTGTAGVVTCSATSVANGNNGAANPNNTFIAGSLKGMSIFVSTAPVTNPATGNVCELWQTISNTDTIAFGLGSTVFSMNIPIKALNVVNQVGISVWASATEKRAIGSSSISSVNVIPEVLFTVTSASMTVCSLTSGQYTTLVSASSIGYKIRVSGVASGNTYDVNNGYVTEQHMMNLGTIPLPWTRRAYTPDAEYAVCGRFFEVIGGDVPGEGLCAASALTTTIFAGVLPYKIRKRTVCTVSFAAPANFQARTNNANYAGTAVAITASVPSSLTSTWIQLTIGSAVTGATSCVLTGSGTSFVYIDSRIG